MSRSHLARECHYRYNYNETPKWVTRQRQAGMGWGVRALRHIPVGTQTCKYGGTLIYDQLLINPDSRKLMQIRYGMQPVWIDATGDKSFGGSVNYGCGITADCPSNVEYVLDDENPLECWLVATRDILKGEFLFFDYGYRYDEEVDGNDPAMCWMKGLSCEVCYPIWDSPPSVLRVEPKIHYDVGFTPLLPCRLIPHLTPPRNFVRML